MSVTSSHYNLKCTNGSTKSVCMPFYDMLIQNALLDWKFISETDAADTSDTMNEVTLNT